METATFCDSPEYFGSAATEKDVEDFKVWVAENYPDVAINWIDNVTAEITYSRGMRDETDLLADEIFSAWCAS